MPLLRAVTTIGGFTMLSRIFGFLRDVLVARYVGAGLMADAFFVAFKLPNFLRRLFAEGAFNAAYVPLFAGTLEENGPGDAKHFAEEVFAVLATILFILVGLAECFMPAVVSLFAPGFVDQPEKFELTVQLSRLCFPYIFFIALVTLYSGILNSMNRFAAVAAAPILLNLCLIIALVTLSDYLPTPTHALSVGVALAGLVQFLWLLLNCQRLGMLPALRRPRFTPRVMKLLTLAAPAAFGAGVAQINLLIDLILASLFSGAVSWLYYADRLNELPIGVIGVATGTALLPMLTRAIRSGDESGAIHQMNHALLLALALTIPATVALIVIPKPLIETIYQHGAFTVEDTAAVWPALIAYAVGLPAFILVKLFSPGFFARQDTKTPVKIALVCVLINLAGNLILMQYFQHVGLALATSFSAWVNATIMGIILFRRGFFLPDSHLLLALAKVTVAAAAMGATLFFSMSYLPWDSLWQRASSLAALTFGGLSIYASLCFIFGLVSDVKRKS